jgi:hypothetical protein
MATPKMMHATEATNLADILERVLDKGIVIAGDKIQLPMSIFNIRYGFWLLPLTKRWRCGYNRWQRILLSKKPKTEMKKKMYAQKRLDRLEEKIKAK